MKMDISSEMRNILNMITDSINVSITLPEDPTDK